MFGLEEELSEEIARLRWFLSKRYEGDSTLLDLYQEINPSWIDYFRYNNILNRPEPPMFKGKT